jgi:hypothetical protein
VIRFDDPEHERQLGELRALSEVELLDVWVRTGRDLCDRNIDDFHLLFQRMVEAVPVAIASERMPNIVNWGKLGWYLLASSTHNRDVLAATIIEAHVHLVVPLPVR